MDKTISFSLSQRHKKSYLYFLRRRYGKRKGLATLIREAVAEIVAEEARKLADDNSPHTPTDFERWLALVHPEVKLTLKQLWISRYIYSLGRGGGKTFLLALMHEYDTQPQ